MSATAELRCEVCGKPIVRRSNKGPAPRYCGKYHKQLAYLRRIDSSFGEPEREIEYGVIDGSGNVRTDGYNDGSGHGPYIGHDLDYCREMAADWQKRLGYGRVVQRTIVTYTSAWEDADASA